MRALDVAFPYLAQAGRIVELGDAAHLRGGILPLPPEVEERIATSTAHADADASGTTILFLPDPGRDTVALDDLRVALEQSSIRDTLVALLATEDWYVRYFLGPLTDLGWVVDSVVSISSRPFDAALVATRLHSEAHDGTRGDLRIRNEYAYLELVERVQLADIDRMGDELRNAKETIGQLRTAVERLEQTRPPDGELDRLRTSRDKARAQADVVTDRWRRAQERASAYQTRASRLLVQLKSANAQLRRAKASNRRIRRSLGYRIDRRIRRTIKWPIVLVGRLLGPAPGASESAPPFQIVEPARSAPVAAASPGTIAPQADDGRARLVRTSPPVALPPIRPLQRELRMAVILDEMSEACFDPECELIRITPNDWQSALEARQPHLLFVESAWQGNGGAWQYKIGRYNHPDAGGLRELVEYCREKGIPTVFWNKEDPVHFDKFKHAAILFDVVFTTDANSVEHYRALPGLRAHTVAALPFAAQPRLHNPINVGERLAVPCFAGSFYGNRHSDRRLQQEMLLDAAREFGLVIYDRNYGSKAPEFEFPERLTPHIKGRLPYKRLARIYKQYRAFLNVNSVIDSPTMLSRRVYELLASGTPVVSTPSRAVESIFGELVDVVHTRDEATAALRRVLGDDGWSDLSRRAVRFVLRNHTYEQRLAEIVRAAGVETAVSDRHGLSCIFLADDPSRIARIAESVVGQDRPDIREVVVGVASAEDTEAANEALVRALPSAMRHAVYVVGGESERDAYARLARLASQPWVLVAPADATDGDLALAGDLMDAVRYADADVIGQATGSHPDPADQTYVDAVDAGMAVIRTSIAQVVGWESTAWSDEWQTRLRREGARFFSVQRIGVAPPVAVGD